MGDHPVDTFTLSPTTQFLGSCLLGATHSRGTAAADRHTEKGLPTTATGTS
ncbi:MAG: hypothetical protein ACLR8Y_10120 [Alistipes indistinctus]